LQDFQQRNLKLPEVQGELLRVTIQDVLTRIKNNM